MNINNLDFLFHVFQKWIIGPAKLTRLELFLYEINFYFYFDV